MTRETRPNRCLKGVCTLTLFILVFFFITTVVRIITDKCLKNHMGLQEVFKTNIPFDAGYSIRKQENTNSSGIVDWERLYPFQSAQINTNDKPSKQRLLDKYETWVNLTESRLELYFKNYLIGYLKIVGLAKRYERTTQWNYAVYSGYNDVIRLPDGHLTSYIEKREVKSLANNTISFADYCKKTNALNFLYIQAPYKISKTQDKTISGIMDFSNQNADELIMQLRQRDVDVYDLREVIEEDGLDHHSLFYKTDHHWRAETGLWAARHIAEYLSSRGVNVDSGFLSEDKFKKVLYPRSFLGSKGRKATLSTTEPEDFSLIYPTYKTQLRFLIPDANIDAVGDFSVIYDMSQIETIDYYGKKPYHAYMYGGSAFTQFENRLTTNGTKILFIHDSFGNVVIPFLSLCVYQIDALDIRLFTGSIQVYIEENRPDVVVILYNPGSIKTEGSAHEKTFDFR